jgi:hypothetical protein
LNRLKRIVEKQNYAVNIELIRVGQKQIDVAELADKKATV